MTLKLIPVEHSGNGQGKKQKHFNPGNKMKRNGQKDSGLKNICLRLVHFINRGSRFTYEQIDEIIMGLQQSILRLQKKKQEILKNRVVRFQKKKIR